MTDIALSMTFTTLTCCAKECGLTFAVPHHWVKSRREDHVTWYCPNGHTQWFAPGTSDLEKERLARQRAEQRVEEYRQDKDAAQRRALHQERRASVFKGHCTRIKKKVVQGKCPCGCDGTFANLRRHMQKHHPDWQPDAEILTPKEVTT